MITENTNLDLLSTPERGTTVRASSILQKNAKVYGPKHALDIEKSSSCWNSDGTQENCQWFVVDFNRPVEPYQVNVQFQAGFSVETCAVALKTSENDAWEPVDELEFHDVHEIQTKNLREMKPCTALKLTLEDFTDFYGRVTIYRIEVWGKELVQG
jgi:hypothetical protein